MATDSVRNLRRHDLDSGRELLDRLDTAIGDLETAGTVNRSLTAVLRRFYHAAHAYYRFRQGDLDGAASELDRAHGAVVEAISAAPFLIPLATHCLDFMIQHVRVAKSREVGLEPVEDRMHRLRAAYLGDEPLCRLESGVALDVFDVRDYYRRYSSDEEDDPAWEPSRRLRDIQSIAMDIFTPSGVVIQYP